MRGPCELADVDPHLPWRLLLHILSLWLLFVPLYVLLAGRRNRVVTLINLHHVSPRPCLLLVLVVLDVLLVLVALESLWRSVLITQQQRRSSVCVLVPPPSPGRCLIALLRHHRRGLVLLVYLLILLLRLWRHGLSRSLAWGPHRLLRLLLLLLSWPLLWWGPRVPRRLGRYLAL